MSPALPRALLWGVVLAALLSLAVAAAPVAWHLAGWSAAMPAQPAVAGQAAAPPAPPDLDPVLALAPFGAVPAPDPEPAGPAAETALDLVLEGVLLQPDPAASMALIAHDGVTAGYRPGDPVAGVATLEEVAATQVVLRVGEDLQTLSFPEGQPEGEAAAPDPATLSGPDRLRQIVAAQTAGDGGGDGGAAAAAPLSVEDRIDLWRERIRANPAEVLDAIGLIPTPEGYRIAEDHDSGVGLAGLRAGDVVRSVNGQAVGDVEQDRQTFDDVAASGLARVEVVRGDRVLTLTFPLR